MNRPAPVELCHKNMRFLITHNPTDSTLSSFIEDLKRYGATTVVRVCDITYDKTPLEKDGINVVDWPFDDGAPPPSKLVDDWLSLLKRKFQEDPGCCVAVHCVAGLGRAPVLVALALIESGMKYEDAIQLIRQKRRGAINSKQLTYLEKYRSKQRLRFKDSHSHKNKCCTMWTHMKLYCTSQRTLSGIQSHKPCYSWKVCPPFHLSSHCCDITVWEISVTLKSFWYSSTKNAFDQGHWFDACELNSLSRRTKKRKFHMTARHPNYLI